MEPLFGTDEDDFLFAFVDGGEVFGLGGNDTLYASEGRDILDGGDGDDVIIGASDGDVLIGGKGADTFVIDPEAVGRLEIKDFELGFDRLDLSGFSTINPLDLHFEPFDYGEILILDDQEIVFNTGGIWTPPPQLKVIDFEAPQPGSQLPLGLLGPYEGLDFLGFLRVNDIGGFNFHHNIHTSSGNYVATYQGTNSPHVISREDPFTVKSLHVGSATRDGVEAIFKAYRGEQLVGYKTVEVDTFQNTRVEFSEFNFGSIDRFELSMTDTGTQAEDVSTNQAWLYIDDLVWA